MRSVLPMLGLRASTLALAAFGSLVACTNAERGPEGLDAREAPAEGASDTGPLFSLDASVSEVNTTGEGGGAPVTDFTSSRSVSDKVRPDGSVPHASDGTSSLDVPGEPSTDAGVSTTDHPSGSLPALTNLRIEGVRFPAQPAFAPERRRYAAIAEETLGNLNIVAEADVGILITIDGHAVESGVPLALPNAQQGTTVVIVVSDGVGGSQQYEVKYLPTTFPVLEARTNAPAASHDPLYVTFRVNEGVSYAAIVDNFGVPYHYAGHAAPVFDLKKHPNGETSYAVYQENGSPAAEHVILDRDFAEQRRVRTVGLQDTDFHEFRILPNGNYLMLAYEPTVRDATAYGGSATQAVRDSIFQEVSPALEVLFQWNSWGQLAYDQSAYAGTNIDYAHLNSLDVDADGNYLVSSRGLSQLAKIDKGSGEVRWRLGGIANEFTFLDDPLNGTCGQHDAHWLPNGNILLFDNGNPCPPENTSGTERTNLSRVVEYQIDEQARTARVVWQYSRPGIFVTTAGSARRLANGNTLIGWGNAAAATATEVDPDGNIVFDLTAYRPESSVITYRVLRFATDG